MTTEELDRLEKRIKSVEHSLPHSAKGCGSVSVSLSHLKDLIRVARENGYLRQENMDIAFIHCEYEADFQALMQHLQVLADELSEVEEQNIVYELEIAKRDIQIKQWIEREEKLADENAEKDTRIAELEATLERAKTLMEDADANTEWIDTKVVDAFVYPEYDVWADAWDKLKETLEGADQNEHRHP